MIFIIGTEYEIQHGLEEIIRAAVKDAQTKHKKQEDIIGKLGNKRRQT